MTTLEARRLAALAKRERNLFEAFGARVAVHRLGSGRPMICLHEAGHDANDFLDLSQRFAGEFEIIAVEWPGHGASPRDNWPASADRYGAIVTHIAPDLVGTPAVVLGHGVGGAAAIRFAAVAPERVAALVLCNPAGLQPVGLLWRLLCRHVARRLEGGEVGDPAFPETFRRFCTRRLLTQPAAEARREAIIEAAPRRALQMRQVWQSYADPGADLRSFTSRLRAPVFYAWARQDPLFLLERCRKAIDATPRHKLATFQAGHAAFLEQPDAFEAELRRFLTSVLGDAAPQADEIAEDVSAA